MRRSPLSAQRIRTCCPCGITAPRTVTCIWPRRCATATSRPMLEEQGCLELETALAIIGQIAWALDWAHGREVVHRDVKPENILLVTGPSQQHAYLADFGLARIATSATLTQFGVSGRALARLRCARAVARRACDSGRRPVRAGRNALLLLDGTPPFWPVGDFEGLRHAHLEQDPPPMERESDPRLEPASPALLRGLAKDPEQRYSSCGDLVVAVRAAVEPEDSALSLPPMTSEHADPHATTEPEQPSSAARSRPPRTRRSTRGAGQRPTRSARPPPGAQVEAAEQRHPRRQRCSRDEPSARREPSTASVDGAAEVARGRRRVLVAWLRWRSSGPASAPRRRLCSVETKTPPSVYASGGDPSMRVAVGGSVWVADKADRTLTRLDRRTAKPSGEPVDVGGAPFRLAGAGEDGSGPSAAPLRRPLASTTRVGAPRPRPVDLSSEPIDVAAGEGEVWIAAKPGEPAARDDGRVIPLDPVSAKRHPCHDRYSSHSRGDGRGCDLGPGRRHGASSTGCALRLPPWSSSRRCRRR